jgi:hypothetical protein
VTEEIGNKSDSLDVPFVPSDNKVLNAMFELAKPTKDDFLIDLGSGDGRIVIGAARSHATPGFGVDLNADLVRIANIRAEKAGVKDKAQFYVRNLFDTDISRASVLTMYLLPEIVQQLRPRVLAELKPGTRVVSHDYHMCDWRPDGIRIVDANPGHEESVVYFWVVSANVDGTWEWEIGPRPYLGSAVVDYVATFRQNYQDIDGKLAIALNDTRLIDARVTGRRVTFTATSEVNERIVRHDFDGVVDGDRITGTVRLSGAMPDLVLPWTAKRTRPARAPANAP